MQVSQSPLLSTSPAKTSKLESVQWPAFHNNGSSYQTEFEAERWKCPLCAKSTPRVRQHLATHKDQIGDWTAAETYCEKVALLKRREAVRKYAKTDGRKETKRKYVKTDGGKETKRKYA